MPSNIDLYALSKHDGAHVVLNNATPFTPSLIYSRVANPEEIYKKRIQGRQILLENPVRAKKPRKALGEKKKKTGPSKKWVKQQGLLKLKESEQKYDLFLPLHHLWLGYVSELLALSAAAAPHPPNHIPNTTSMHTKLVKADFHGCIMTVRRSKNPCLVGLSGIVIYESENALRIITKSDKLKLVPKQNSVFAFAVPLYSTLGSALTATETVFDRARLEFELYGNQFQFRAADRASRKFKHKETIEV